MTGHALNDVFTICSAIVAIAVTVILVVAAASVIIRIVRGLAA